LICNASQIFGIVVFVVEIVVGHLVKTTPLFSKLCVRLLLMLVSNNAIECSKLIVLLL
jgi:hypothetical protein